MVSVIAKLQCFEVDLMANTCTKLFTNNGDDIRQFLTHPAWRFRVIQGVLYHTFVRILCNNMSFGYMDIF